MLSEIAIKCAKSIGKAYKLSDERGMYLLINAEGAKYWRLDYRIDGKRKTLALGVHPDISLKSARASALSMYDAAQSIARPDVGPTFPKEFIDRVAGAFWHPLDWLIRKVFPAADSGLGAEYRLAKFFSFQWWTNVCHWVSAALAIGVMAAVG